MRRLAIRAAATAVAAGALLFTAPAAGAATLPIGDPKTSGVIGLCDQKLQPITGGSLATTPFVWRAVGASAAPGAWAEPGRTATLYAYQPRPSVPAAQWSGLQLTSSGHYTNPAHPMAQATRGDTSLADFVAQYPPMVDGLLELRLYLGGPQLPIYSQAYDTTFIRVTGSSWQVVQGGPVSCTAGSSVSAETVLLPSSVVNPPPSATASAAPSTGRASGSSGSARSTDAVSATTTSGPSGAPSGSAVAGGASSASTSSGHAGLVWTGVVALAVLLAAAAWVVRRRRTAST